MVLDADAVAREVVELGRPALEEIAAAFGSGVLEADGTLNRKELGDIVFADKSARDRLEQIMHPRIRDRMAELSEAALQSSAPLLVHDIPLLFETSRNREYPEIMVVYIPRALQLERLISRTGITVGAAERRLSAQMPIDEKRALATWVIDNSGTPAQTRSQFDAWWANEVVPNVPA